MIDFTQGGLVDIWPDKGSPQIQALSYAIQQAMIRLKKYADQTMRYSYTDNLQDSVLDYLAIEMRSMYYDQTFDLTQKREIIKNTLKWYSRAGTPAAVSEMVSTIFGYGEVIEWYDFDPIDGEIVPGEFDIMTNAQLTPNLLEEMRDIIMKLKNARSHLRKVVVRKEGRANLYIANVNTFHSTITIHDSGLEGINSA